MDASKLLQWQYLIYLLPGGISAMLLLLSSLRMGHRGGHGGHGHSGVHGIAGHGAQGSHAVATSSPASHSVGNHHGGVRLGSHAGGPKVQAKIGKVEVARHGANKENVTVSTNILLHITGVDRAPVAMLLEAFCLTWGVCGYWANEFTVHVASATVAQMLPSLGIALGGGVLGARIAAEVIARVMPKDESQDVSRNGLFGLTGQIAFPVSATAGRIHLYDEHGTLHDEMCRVAAGHEAIVKGRTAMVVDMDAQGHLVVEEVPGAVH